MCAPSCCRLGPRRCRSPRARAAAIGATDRHFWRRGGKPIQASTVILVWSSMTRHPPGLAYGPPESRIRRTDSIVDLDPRSDGLISHHQMLIATRTPNESP